MTSEVQTYSTAKIRQLLLKDFDDPGLDAFCQDYFPAVYEKLSRGMRRDEKITLLLDYAHRQGNLVNLLTLAQGYEYKHGRTTTQRLSYNLWGIPAARARALLVGGLVLCLAINALSLAWCYLADGDVAVVVLAVVAGSMVSLGAGAYALLRGARRIRAAALLLLTGLALLTTLTVGLSWYRTDVKRLWYTQVMYPDRIVVLVAEFSEGASSERPQDRTVSEAVLDAIQEVEQADPHVVVVPLDEVILDEDTARAQAAEYDATIVVYGWYARSGTDVLVDVGFEVPAGRRPRSLPVETTGETKMTAALAEMESFRLVLALAGEMKCLTAFTVGLVYYDEADYDRAIDRFDEAVACPLPDSGRVGMAAIHFYRGLAYSRQDDYDRAIADYTQAIQLQPDHAQTYYNRGLAYSRQDDYDRAIVDYTQAIRLKPDYAKAYNNRGFTYSNKGDYDRAIADYNEAIRLQPDYALAYHNRGLAYGRQGDYDQAIADFTVTIRLQPDYAPAYNNRGYAYHNKGDYDRAIADLDVAIRLQPDYATAYYNRGSAYRLKGDNAQAIADFERFLDLSKDPTRRAEAEKHLRELRGD